MKLTTRITCALLIAWLGWCSGLAGYIHMVTVHAGPPVPSQSVPIAAHTISDHGHAHAHVHHAGHTNQPVWPINEHDSDHLPTLPSSHDCVACQGLSAGLYLPLLPNCQALQLLPCELNAAFPADQPASIAQTLLPQRRGPPSTGC